MRLITKRTSQRGVTLVELVIVLALLIVITTLIISLTTALNGLVKVNERLYQSIEDLTISRNYIENWFYSFDEKDNIYSIVNGNLTIKTDDGEYKIWVDSSILYAEYPENINLDNTNNSDNANDNTNIENDESEGQESNGFEFEGLKNIEFENYENTRLYKCLITYESDGEEKQFSFILGRRS